MITARQSAEVRVKYKLMEIISSLKDIESSIVFEPKDVVRIRRIADDVADVFNEIPASLKSGNPHK